MQPFPIRGPRLIVRDQIRARHEEAKGVPLSGLIGWESAPRMPFRTLTQDVTISSHPLGAERRLRDEIGGHNEMWFVGKKPVAHLSAADKKTFFMKCHILAGKVDLNRTEAEDHAWVTAEELEKYLSPAHYSALSGALL
ncbi:hypothetical protein BDK51DRAFT_38114 [Blyttiomyces helicus]|uniref:Uncharacterized protein n=1 Tax=Blyttiomyces helicus TaxID=388810 RepID=A0A4P9WF86_9FUNG|nr:hypothetical protein BDK51DRAFT_38114 [Blyttiomyces helicus]|eukprot:RKO90403.1 hypothetical protein BDK51DRAFT_38114 [Blyttiomyces helicus]